MQKLFRRKKNLLLDGVESEARDGRASTARPARLRVPGSRGWEIGRASCRERVL